MFKKTISCAKVQTQTPIIYSQYHDDPPAVLPIPTKKIPTQAEREKRMAEQRVRKRKTRIRIGLGALIIVVAAVVVGVAVVLTKKKGSSASGGNGGKGGKGGSGSPSLAIAGTNGSTVTMDNGTTFIYTNNFGGDWAFDPKNPFAPGGRPQNYTPRVGQDAWVWGQDIVRGVNLG